MQPLELHIQLLEVNAPSHHSLDPGEMLHLPFETRKQHANECRNIADIALFENDKEKAVENFVRALLLLDGSHAGQDSLLSEALNDGVDERKLRNACRLGLAKCAFHLGEYRRCRAYCDLILAETMVSDNEHEKKERGEAYRWRAKSHIEMGVDLDEAKRDLARAKGMGIRVGEEGRRLTIMETEEMDRIRKMFKGLWL